MNLREGQPDNPAKDTHFMINLNTFWIHDKFKDERFHAPPEISEDLSYLKNYVHQHVRKQRSWEESRAIKQQEKRDADRKALMEVRIVYFILEDVTT